LGIGFVDTISLGKIHQATIRFLLVVKNALHIPTVEASSVYQSPSQAFGPRVLTAALITQTTSALFMNAQRMTAAALKTSRSGAVLNGIF